VRVGSYRTREEAELPGATQRRRDAFWVVSEGAGVRQPALTVHQEASVGSSGSAFALAASGEAGTIRVAGRYRGRVEVISTSAARPT
jgi:hypothetical protein